MSAPSASDPRPTGLPRRLEAGDWVVAAPWVRSLPGLGKLVEGDYDPRDAALLRARVEWTHGSHWMPVGDLERVEPPLELALARRALAARVVTFERADRLRELIEAVESGQRRFVRSPGLLDLLWTTLQDDDRPRGLVKFFEEGSRSLPVAARVPALPPEARATSTAPRSPPPAGQESRPAPPAEPRRPAVKNPPTPAGVWHVLLSTLNDEALRALLREWRVQPRGKADDLRTHVRSTLSMREVVSALDQAAVRYVAGAVGVVDAGLWHVDALREAIERLADPDLRPDASPSGSELARRLLDALDLQDLELVLRGCGLPAYSQDPDTLRRHIIDMRLPMDRLLAPLGPEALRRATRAAGLVVSPDTPAAHRVALLAHAEGRAAVADATAPSAAPPRPSAPPPRRAGPVDPAVERAAHLLGPVALWHVLAKNGRTPSGAEPDRLAAEVIASGLTYAELLAALTDGERAGLMRALERHPQEPQRRTPRSGADVVPAIVAALPATALWWAIVRRGVRPRSPQADALRAQLLELRPDAADLAQHLSTAELALAAQAIGLPPEGGPAELRAAIVARAVVPPRPPLAPTSIVGVEARALVLDAALADLDDAGLRAFADAASVPASIAPTIAGLANAPAPLEALLARRTPRQLDEAAARLGVSPARDGRWALLALAALDAPVLLAAAREAGLDVTGGAEAAAALVNARLPVAALLCRLARPALGRAAALLLLAREDHPEVTLRERLADLAPPLAPQASRSSPPSPRFGEPSDPGEPRCPPSAPDLGQALDALAASGLLDGLRHREQPRRAPPELHDLVARALVGVEARFVVLAALLESLRPDQLRAAAAEAGLADPQDVTATRLATWLAARRASLDGLLRGHPSWDLRAAAETLGLAAPGGTDPRFRWTLGLLANLDGASIWHAARALGLEERDPPAAALALVRHGLPLLAGLRRLEAAPLERAARWLGLAGDEATLRRGLAELGA